MHKKVIFPGTFDPITYGHLDLIQRTSSLFSEVVVAVAQASTGRMPFFSFEERLDMVIASVKTMPHVLVKGFHGLLIDFYRSEQATAVVRGVRNANDFEYEFQMAQINHQLSADLETIFLTPTPTHLFISATMVREIVVLGGDIHHFVPPPVQMMFEKKLKMG